MYPSRRRLSGLPWPRPRSTSSLAEPRRLHVFLRLFFRENWGVYVKPPFGGPEHVLTYLARYTHRVAISNHRLVAFQNDRVSFRWKDYARGGKQKIMSVSADEFLRRFLIHVLPKGLVRIRHFGLFANRRRRDMLSRCRDLLSVHCANDPDTTTHLPCPVCAGPMFIIERLTSSQLYFQSALTMSGPRDAALTPPEMAMAQLVSINVCCRCVPARHALVCSLGHGVLQTPPSLSQVKTPMQAQKQRALSSPRLLAVETPCNQHGRIEIP